MLWKRFFDMFATTNGMSVFDDTPMEWMRTSFECAQKVQGNCLAQRSAHVSRGGCEERTCDDRDGPRVFGLEYSLQDQAHTPVDSAMVPTVVSNSLGVRGNSEQRLGA